MTYSVKGRVQGSKPQSFSKQDAYRLGLNILWVALAAVFTYLLTLIPNLPHNNPTMLGLTTVITALFQFLQKYFSDTRNIPVVGADTVEKIPDATDHSTHYYHPK